jgi:hypothetical protein
VAVSAEPSRRTRVVAIIAVFAVLAVGVFFGVRALIDLAPAPTASPTPTATPDVGVVYTSDAFGYRIQFPAEPAEQSRTIPSDDGDIQTTSAAWDNGVRSLVSTGATYPAGVLADVTESLKSALDGLVANTPDAELVSSDPVTLAGLTAVSATITVPSGTVIVIIAIDGDTQYQLVAANLDPETAEGFFATFELT